MARILKPATFRIDVELLAGLKALKARDGMPEGEAVRRALVAFLQEKGVLPGPEADRRRANIPTPALTRQRAGTRRRADRS